MFRYQREKSFEERTQETQKINRKWPGRVPIIVEIGNSARIKPLRTSKILCGVENSFSFFLGVIRKKMKIPQDTALFLFLNGNTLVTGEEVMGDLYQRARADDGFLYFLATDQEVMG